MSQSLIPVAKGLVSGREVRTVDARELHRFLEVRTEFRHWIKRRIGQYGFLIDVDFVAVKIDRHEIIEQFDYHLTLDMAKELAMVERTERGREARRYFIACERRALAAARASATRHKRKSLEHRQKAERQALQALAAPIRPLPPEVRSQVERLMNILQNWSDPNWAPMDIAKLHVGHLRLVANG